MTSTTVVAFAVESRDADGPWIERAQYATEWFATRGARMSAAFHDHVRVVKVTTTVTREVVE